MREILGRLSTTVIDVMFRLFRLFYGWYGGDCLFPSPKWGDNDLMEEWQENVHGHELGVFYDSFSLSSKMMSSGREAGGLLPYKTMEGFP